MQPMPSIFAPQQPSGPPAQPAFQGTLGNQNMRQVFNQPASQPPNIGMGGKGGQQQQYTREEGIANFNNMLGEERMQRQNEAFQGIGSIGQVRRR